MALRRLIRSGGKFAFPTLLVATTSVADCAFTAHRSPCLPHKPSRPFEPSARGGFDCPPFRVCEKVPVPRRTTRPLSSTSSSVLGSELAALRKRFRPGDYYVWLYRDGSGTPSSFERYQVTNTTTVTEKDVVEIEMATKFDVKDEYVVHHRMTVDLSHHLWATEDRRDWTLDAFEYRDPQTGEWIPFGAGGNVQAFEEKFDCFAMLRGCVDEEDEGGSESRYQGRNAEVDSEPVTLIRSDRHYYTESWYGPITHQTLSGVALVKYFKEHSFSLVAVGQKGKGETSVRVEL